MSNSDHLGREIRDRAMTEVADRIAELGARFHPAAVPIVAANVAMASVARQLFGLDSYRWTYAVAELLDECAPARAAEASETVERVATVDRVAARRIQVSQDWQSWVGLDAETGGVCPNAEWQRRFSAGDSEAKAQLADLEELAAERDA